MPLWQIWQFYSLPKHFFVSCLPAEFCLLSSHPVQPSTYHQYFPTKPYPLVQHLHFSFSRNSNSITSLGCLIQHLTTLLESALAQIEVIPFGPSLVTQDKGLTPHLATTSFQIVVESYKVSAQT